MAEIREQSGISSSQASMFFPKERFYIPKSTVQRTKSIITSLNSGIVTKDFKNTQSTPYDFVIQANNLSIFDLQQFYFNIAGELELNSDVPVNTEDLIFGNLFVSSLFQNATLEIGGATIAQNTNPGVDANLQALLKFDQYDLKNNALSDREFMINALNPNVNITPIKYQFENGDLVLTAENSQYPVGKSADGRKKPQLKNMCFYYYNSTKFTPGTGITQQNAYKIMFDDEGAATVQFYTKQTDPSVTIATPFTYSSAEEREYTVWSIDDVIEYHNNTSVIPSVLDSGFKPGTNNKIYIPFRCKLYLSDLFNYTVDSLDYIFNRDIKITLTRASSSNIICNLSHIGSTQASIVNVSSTSKFELVAYSYLLTDTARNELLKFYSRPIETLFGVQTVNLTPLYQESGNTEQNITLPLTVNYDTKAIILAFPKCSNCLVPLSTGRLNNITGQIPANTPGVYQTNWMFSNCNSYNYAGLKYVRVSNTNNQSIAFYDFSGTAIKCGNLDPLFKSFDFTNSADNAEGTNNDYREIYEQMKELRLLFGKSPDNAVDYNTFLKDYFIIPIDLTGSNIPPNTRIFVNFQFDNWQEPYNPLYFGNNKANNKLTTNLMAIYFGRDVLTYNPDGTCIVKHILSANPTEKKVNLV